MVRKDRVADHGEERVGGRDETSSAAGGEGERDFAIEDGYCKKYGGGGAGAGLVTAGTGVVGDGGEVGVGGCWPGVMAC